MTLQFDGTNDPTVYRSRAEACGQTQGLRSTFRDGRKVMVRRAERRRLLRFTVNGCGWAAVAGLLFAGTLFFAAHAIEALLW